MHKSASHICLLFLLTAAQVFLGAAATSAAPAHQPAAETAEYVAGEVLLKLRPGLTLIGQGSAQGETFAQQSEAESLNRLLDVIQVSQAELMSPGSATYQIHYTTNTDAAELAATIAAHPAVVYAEPNYVRRLMRTEPNDPFVREQWALTNIQAYEAWDITTGAGVPIAVLDTGVMSSHPDLSGNVGTGYNALTGSSQAEDDNGHGTAVSGLIAARTDNGEGIAGMCWDCNIIPVKVLNARGSGNDMTVARGIRWAADAGARIINLSLGGSGDSQVLSDAVGYANARGVLIVAASGNERQSGNAVNYPAAYDEVLAVGGTGNTDQVTGFSNTGAHLDLAAPSVGLWTTIPGERRYGPPNGTSFSSPYVAGAAGLVFTLRPDLSHTDVKCILEAGSDDQGEPGKDPEYGWGRLNAFKSLQLAQEYAGCPLNGGEPNAPAPEPQPFPDNPAFAPVEPVTNSANVTYFPETQHTVRGEFKNFWETYGGLPIFGFPLSEEFTEEGDDGNTYVVQYFQRYRFEFHPENDPPYNVQLARLSPLILENDGRNWYTFTKQGPTPGCIYFEETEQALCEPFLSYWQSFGLEFDGQPGFSQAESLALFGQPLSQQQVEEVEPGVFVTVQWFERARFEFHDNQGVLLGLLGDELAQQRGWRP